MNAIRLSPNACTIACAIGLLGACAEEPPPRSVNEFMENPILLEATVVRCSQNRAETRYDPECVNAREAVSRIAAKEEQAGRAALEAQSDRKREALRRTQAAAAEARRRTAEAARLREETEYLSQFGQLPATDAGNVDAPAAATNAPTAVIPKVGNEDGSSGGATNSLPASDGGNAPVIETAPAGDLNQIRDELRRRGEEPASDSTQSPKP